MVTPIELVQGGDRRHGCTRGFGRIVNITSLSVYVPIPGLDVSSGARAGLTAFLAGVARTVAAATSPSTTCCRASSTPTGCAAAWPARRPRRGAPSAALCRRRSGQAARHAGGIRPDLRLPVLGPCRLPHRPEHSRGRRQLCQRILSEVAPARSVETLPWMAGTHEHSQDANLRSRCRRRSISTNIRPPESWRSRRQSRSATSATWRSPIRRASPLPAWRSATIRRPPPTIRRAPIWSRVISNGTAVLGLGNIGPLAAKPVMEGKAVLFKKFAGIDVFDIEIDAPEIERMVETDRRARADLRRHQSRGHQGAGMLRGRGAPQGADEHSGLPRRPARHRDHRRRRRAQRAGTRRQDDRDVKIVTSGAGAAALACLNLLVSLGARRENIWVTDRIGVAYKRPRRGDGSLEGPLRQGRPRRARLADVIGGADVFLGLSAAGVLKPELLAGHGGKAADPGARQSGAGDHAGGGARGAAGCDDLHRPIRFSQPGQQRALLSLHLPRRARLRRHAPSTRR